jgi:hypothetical protein
MNIDMKKQTAVEWLEDNMYSLKIPAIHFVDLMDLVKQALAMEWEQLIEAHADGQYLNSVSLTKRMCLDNAESYFNETYGGDK